LSAEWRARLKHFAALAVSHSVRLSRRLKSVAQLLTALLMGSLTFLAGHSRGAPAPAPGERRVASAQAMAEAFALSEAGQEQAAAHQPAAALVNLRRAYDLSSDPTLLLDVAELERELGNAARSTQAYELFLERGAARVAAPRAAFARRQLKLVAVGTARVTLQANVQGAEVELEPERGVAETAGFLVTAVLDAGERKISLSKPGYETQSLSLTLEPGEVRSLRVDLDKASGGRSETRPDRPRLASVVPSPQRGG
jgi:hypothetical protein